MMILIAIANRLFGIVDLMNFCISLMLGMIDVLVVRFDLMIVGAFSLNG